MTHMNDSLRQGEVFAKANEWQDGDVTQTEMSLPKMHLIEMRDRSPFRKIVQSCAGGLVAGLAFNCENRLSILQDDKIHLTLVGIAQISKLHAVAFRVLNPVAVLQKLRRHQ